MSPSKSCHSFPSCGCPELLHQQEYTVLGDSFSAHLIIQSIWSYLIYLDKKNVLKANLQGLKARRSVFPLWVRKVWGAAGQQLAPGTVVLKCNWDFQQALQQHNCTRNTESAATPRSPTPSPFLLMLLMVMRGWLSAHLPNHKGPQTGSMCRAAPDERQCCAV